VAYSAFAGRQALVDAVALEGFGELAAVLEAEVAWSALHGLATLQAGGRLRPRQAQARLDLALRMLTQ
jgi:hypothetical protein